MNKNSSLIGMLHIPINTLLTSTPDWRKAVSLSSACKMRVVDWDNARKLKIPGCQDPGCRCCLNYIGKVEKLTIWGFLEQLMLDEAAIYQKNGITSLMLENVAAPYFVRGSQPPVIYWVMRALAERLRKAYPNLRIGIQILAYSDDWAMDIACRCGLDFIRCESALFEGVRPEGRAPNAGNLASMYMTRNMLITQLGKDGPVPQVYVDVQKKHTVFMSELDSLDVWLENILFQKLEGVIITGRATGVAVDEADLRRARELIDKAKADSFNALGVAWESPLIVGSGVSVANIAMCKQFADAVIVGSSLKKNGYWECPLDEERLKRFMEVWSQ